MKKIKLLSLIGFVLLSCGQGKESSKGEQNNNVLAKGIQEPPAGTPANDLYSDGIGKIIKTADYRFQVANVSRSQDQIEALVRKYSAYISSSNLELDNPILEEHITIRVLSDYFDNLLKEIDGQATFVNRRKVTTEDAAKEFVDLESRLRTKREVEQRYTEILRKKAGTIEELLKAEQQIGELHEEIEATISRINFLRDQVRYSTINLEFYQTIEQRLAEVTPGLGMGKKFADAFRSGFSGMVGLLVALTYLWPILVAGLALVLVWRKRKFILIRKG